MVDNFKFRARSNQLTQLNVDFGDVLDQAVKNERYKVIRKIRRQVESLATQELGVRSYSGSEIQSQVLKILDTEEYS